MGQNVSCTVYHSPVGNLLLGATATDIVLCDWINTEGYLRTEIINRLRKCGMTIDQGPVQSGIAALLKEAAAQLDEYFQGTRQQFNLPIKTFGTTFQQQVWQQLQSIPYSTTMTYKQQAITIGCPKAVRAVANANRLNALSIIIPCHRVIGTNNILTGYAGGLNAKRWLIKHEQHEGC